jgi:hypothetical protein
MGYMEMHYEHVNQIKLKNTVFSDVVQCSLAEDY